MTQTVKGCHFCDIIHHEKDKHLKTGENVVLIEDKTPRAPYHFLILSKRHINKACDLTPADLPLLKEMDSIGRSFLRETLKDKGEADTVEDMLRMGFHWSKLVSIHHLHLHVLYPISQMRILYRMFVFRPGMFFHTLKDVTDGLERTKNDGKTDVEVQREENPPPVNPEGHEDQRRLSSATGMAC